MAQSGSALKSSQTEKEGPSKRKAILDAATRVFLKHGYGAASMDAVAQEAGVSKQTIYSHFGDKNSLFESIIEEKCDQLLGPMQKPEIHADDPRATLTEMAKRFLDIVLDPENMAHFRVVVAECVRFPDLAKIFYRAGPRLAAERLAEYLAQVHGKGVLHVPDPLSSARLFFGMLREDLYMRHLLDLGPAPSAADIDRVVRQAVQAFLKAHKAR